MDLVVGRVAKAHGIGGEVVVDVRTDDPDGRFAPGTALRARARDETERDLRRRCGARARRPAAGAARGRRQTAMPPTRCAARLFLVDSADLPPIEDPDEFYDHQLEGLRVRTVDRSRGRHRRRGAAHRRGRVARRCRPMPTAEVLVPFVGAIVTSVSLADGIVEIDPPEGLLDLESI